MHCSRDNNSSSSRDNNSSSSSSSSSTKKVGYVRMELQGCKLTVNPPGPAGARLSCRLLLLHRTNLYCMDITCITCRVPHIAAAAATCHHHIFRQAAAGWERQSV
jgi:hypothetical protein